MNFNFFKFIPGYRQLSDLLRRHYDQHGSNPFIKFAPPGHFYSPIPDIEFVDRNRTTLFDCSITRIPGIENNINCQLALISKFSEYYDELPYREEGSSGLRYYSNNSQFSYGDAIILYSMLRYYRPKRIIEVGSGFSSAVILDTNDLFFTEKIAVTFIEPYPKRLLSLLNDEDTKQHEIISCPVQEIPLERFATLEANDILFIDSSHVAKIGSDVVHLVTNVLPILKEGVIVHFHDIFWPFEYTQEWIREGRAWNENYILKAFLQFNPRLNILIFSHFLWVHYKHVFEQSLPSYRKAPGCSLWLEMTNFSKAIGVKPVVE